MRALLAFRPEIAPPIVDLTNTLLHAPNSLTRGERELIAAYVSSLNDCTFCHDSHAAIASCHLNEDETFVDSVIAMHPYYIARTVGGLLFLIGTLVGCYNVWMTIRTAPLATRVEQPVLPEQPLLQPGE